jgi:prolyl 4-hydroxylase
MQLPPHIAQAFSLVSAGRAEEAVALLEGRAARGDGPALFQMAEWHREGAHVPRDIAKARDLYGKAGQAGLIEAQRRYIALLASGAGGPRDWRKSLSLLTDLARVDPAARRQIEVVRAMRLSSHGSPISVPAGQPLSEALRLVRFPGLFSEAECRYLAEAAGPMFERATTVDERTGQLLVNPVRTSDTAVFPWIAQNPVVEALNRRIAMASGTDVAQGEPLQVLRYAPGQEYKPHIDAIPGLENQRILTVLVYLNDDFAGGETEFIKAGVTVRARRGDAILFGNVDSEGRPNHDAIHAGLPVTRGTKLLASRWIRAAPTGE